jgi:hypothetical protein
MSDSSSELSLSGSFLSMDMLSDMPVGMAQETIAEEVATAARSHAEMGGLD